jgi:hypothetical protein
MAVVGITAEVAAGIAVLVTEIPELPLRHEADVPIVDHRYRWGRDRIVYPLDPHCVGDDIPEGVIGDGHVEQIAADRERPQMLPPRPLIE